MHAIARHFGTTVLALTWTACRRDPPSAPPTVAATVQAGGVLQKVELTRRGDHAELALTCNVTNSGPSALTLQSPAVRLLAEGGRAVPPLIAPLLSPPVVAPGVAETVTLHYWLAPADLSGPLELHINGQRFPVTL